MPSCLGREQAGRRSSVLYWVSSICCLDLLGEEANDKFAKKRKKRRGIEAPRARERETDRNRATWRPRACLKGGGGVFPVRGNVSD